MINKQITIKGQKAVLIMATISTFGSLLFGYNTGVINGALPYMAAADQLNLTPVLEGLVGSAICLGAAIGSVIGGRMADLVGRRTNLIYLSILFFLATLGCALAINSTMMITFRFLLGIAVGGASVTVPAYLAEIATDNLRGRLVVMMDLVIVAGQLLAYIVNAAIAIMMGDDPYVWRYLLGVASLPAILLFFGMLYNRESPRWLVTKGRISEALEVLRITHNSKAKAISELNDIQDLLGETASSKSFSLKDFTIIWVKRILILGIAMSVIQQITGVAGIMFYGSQILTTSGFSTNAALIGNISNGVISVVGSLLGFYMVGKMGRRTMLAIGLIGTLASNIIVGIASMVFANSAMLPYCVLSLTVIFLAFQQSCVSPATWVMLSEIFPLRMRGIGMGLAVFCQWIGGFLVTFSFPIFIGFIGLASTFFVFAGCCLVSLVFVKFCMPETKGMSIEDIERKFRSESGEIAGELASIKK